MIFLKDLLYRLLSDRSPERVSALLALLAGLSISIAFLALVWGSIYLRDGYRYAVLIGSCLTALTSMALFGKK